MSAWYIHASTNGNEIYLSYTSSLGEFVTLALDGNGSLLWSIKNNHLNSHGYGAHYYNNIVYSLGRTLITTTTNDFVAIKIDSSSGTLISEFRISGGDLSSDMKVQSFYGDGGVYCACLDLETQTTPS